MEEKKKDDTIRNKSSQAHQRSRLYEKNIGNISNKLKNILNSEVINKIAKATGFVQRRGKCEGHEMFFSLIGGFAVGQATEIAGMLRAFSVDTEIGLQYNAWYKRLQKDGFPLFMQEMFTHLMSYLYQETFNLETSQLNDFDDIYIQDGSSFSVNKLLKKHFPGRFTKISPAAIEVHAFYSMRQNTFEYLGVAADSVSEVDFMPNTMDVELKNRLCLFDRGYCGLEHLHKIDEAEGFFLVRSKSNINPVIDKVYRSDGRRASTFVGKNLNDICLKKNEDYDFSITPNRKEKFQELRLIAIWSSKSKKHIYFYTNANRTKLPFKKIGNIYRLRWQIELLFKEMKSHTELRKFLTANKNIAEGFVWASFCAVIIRKFLVGNAQTLAKTKLSFHKAAISARTFMNDFIKCALNQFAKLEKCLDIIFERIQKYMKFSNPHRKSSFDNIGISIV